MKNRRAFLKAAGTLGAFGAFPPAIRTALVPILSALSGCETALKNEGGKAQMDMGYLLTPIPFSNVRLNDGFWKPRLETQAKTLVPFAFEKTQPAVENLRKTGAFLRGDKSSLPFPHRFMASDLYKVMEGAAYLLTANRDPVLERHMDEIIDIIAAAQRSDGYLYEAHITGVSKSHEPWGPGGMGDKPYSWEVHSHELYNMGHMYEAAVAYYQATGKDKWLQVAEKSARHINKVFFEGDLNYNNGKPVNQAPGHQGLELALCKLYRVTGTELYLNMAKRFLDIRGVTYQPEGEGPMAPSAAQQHMPVAQQREAVGHAVRAVYMYSGMADVDALRGTHDYDRALDSIWHDIVDTKMHITGGLGAVHGIEGFGPAYELPNKETYNETCAAVGNVLFNFRMFLLTRDARFMDVAEVALFNNALAGTNLAGNRFFYVNPLEADGRTPFNHGEPGRSAWFDTACCPSNLARLIPQVPGLMYAHGGDEIYATLYGSSSTAVELKSGKVGIQQEANYPFDGQIVLTLHPERSQAFRLNLRIPTWASANQFVPGDLYDYADAERVEWKLRINGQVVTTNVAKGFAAIDRTWHPGDKVTLTLPMPVRFNRANVQVRADRGRVAITRGPLVFCAEGIDNAEPVQQFYVSPLPSASSIVTSTFDQGVLKGLIRIELPAKRASGPDSRLVLVPYYAWDNRGDGSMLVWLPANSDVSETRVSNVD
jgi:uncharacterized protein